MKKLKQNILMPCLIAVFMLSACGGESDNESSSLIEQTPLVASNGFNTVLPDTQSYIDLSLLIATSASGAEVTGVYLESTQGSGTCSPVNSNQENDDDSNLISDLGFTVTIIGSAICEYTYDVETVAVSGQTKIQDSATMVVVSSTDGDAVLPPISIAMAIDDGELLTNIKTALGDDFPTDYILSDDFSVLGDGDVAIDTANFTVSYTPTAEGVSRVVYTLEGFIEGVADTKLGTIDYAVSDGLNEAPTADSFTFEDEVTINTAVDIDVENHISDGDDDDLQLIDVQSYLAEVVVQASDEDFSNTTFSFETSSYGMHYVSYTVSDLHGGFATAIIEIKIDDPNSVNLWADVENNGLVFSGPMTVIEADELELDYQDFFSDSHYYPAVDVTSYSDSGSQAYCSSLGARLPTSDEFTALIDAQDPANNWNWPSGLQYTTLTDSDTFMSSSLSTGEVGDFSEPSYVTCVSSSELTTSVSDASIVADGSDVAEITLTFKHSDTAVSDAEFFVEVTGNAQLSDDTVTTDLDGTASVFVSNTTAEEVFVSFTYATPQSELISSIEPVTFIGDAETARIATLTVTKNNAFADGTDENTLIAQLLDANDNPVSDINILVEKNSDNPTVIGGRQNVITNTEGEGEFSVTNTIAEDVVFTALYTTPSTEIETSQEAVVTFNQLYTSIKTEVNYQAMGSIGRNIVVTTVLSSQNTPVQGADVFFTANDSDTEFVDENGDSLATGSTGITISTDKNGEARVYLSYTNFDNEYANVLVTSQLVNSANDAMSQSVFWEQFPLYDQFSDVDLLIDCYDYEGYIGVEPDQFLKLMDSKYSIDVENWDYYHYIWGGSYGGNVYGRYAAAETSNFISSLLWVTENVDSPDEVNIWANTNTAVFGEQLICHKLAN